MIDAILSLIPGGGLTALGGLIVAALGLLFGLYKSIKSSGKKEAKADAFEEELDRLSKAADARARANRGELHDDKYDRDSGSL